MNPVIIKMCNLSAINVVFKKQKVLLLSWLERQNLPYH